jgi:hypothetical protein
MQLPWSVRSTTFRWTFLVAGAFAAFTVALLGFVYLKMKHDLTMQFDRAIGLQMDVLADLPPGQRLDSINEGIRAGFRLGFGSSDCLAQIAAGARAMWKASRLVSKWQARHKTL